MEVFDDEVFELQREMLNIGNNINKVKNKYKKTLNNIFQSLSDLTSAKNTIVSNKQNSTHRKSHNSMTSFLTKRQSKNKSLNLNNLNTPINSKNNREAREIESTDVYTNRRKNEDKELIEKNNDYDYNSNNYNDNSNYFVDYDSNCKNYDMNKEDKVRYGKMSKIVSNFNSNCKKNYNNYKNGNNNYNKYNTNTNNIANILSNKKIAPYRIRPNYNTNYRNNYLASKKRFLKNNIDKLMNNINYNVKSKNDENADNNIENISNNLENSNNNTDNIDNVQNLSENMLNKNDDNSIYGKCFYNYSNVRVIENLEAESPNKNILCENKTTREPRHINYYLNKDNKTYNNDYYNGIRKDDFLNERQKFNNTAHNLVINQDRKRSNNKANTQNFNTRPNSNRPKSTKIFYPNSQRNNYKTSKKLNKINNTNNQNKLMDASNKNDNSNSNSNNLSLTVNLTNNSTDSKELYYPYANNNKEIKNNTRIESGVNHSHSLFSTNYVPNLKENYLNKNKNINKNSKKLSPNSSFEILKSNINSIFGLLGVNDISSAKKRINSLKEFENFTEKMKKIYKNFNEDNEKFCLRDILFWAGQIGNSRDNSEIYENYCRSIMEEYNLDNFEDFREFIDRLLRNNNNYYFNKETNYLIKNKTFDKKINKQLNENMDKIALSSSNGSNKNYISFYNETFNNNQNNIKNNKNIINNQLISFKGLEEEDNELM